SPVALARTTNGIAPSFSRMSSAVAMYSPIFSGGAIEVYQSRQSSPSAAARLSASSCSRASGSSVAWAPFRVTGSTNATLAPRPCHKGDPLEQVHILLVLEERPVERRNDDLLVRASQRFGRDLLGEQQLQPVEKLGGRRL